MAGITDSMTFAVSKCQDSNPDLFQPIILDDPDYACVCVDPISGDYLGYCDLCDDVTTDSTSTVGWDYYDDHKFTTTEFIPTTTTHADATNMPTTIVPFNDRLRKLGRTEMPSERLRIPIEPETTETTTTVTTHISTTWYSTTQTIPTPECPKHMIYDYCGSYCPLECGVRQSKNCPTECYAGCVCTDGYIMFNNVCIKNEYCRLSTPSDCHQKLALAGKDQSHGKLDGFVPSCDDNGNWQQSQCHMSLGECWCVGPTGEEIVATRMHGDPACHGSKWHSKHAIMRNRERNLETRDRLTHFRQDENPTVSDCNVKLVQAKDAIGEGALAVFLPTCDLNGDWAALQCYTATGYCWCVTTDGTATPSELVEGAAGWFTACTRKDASTDSQAVTVPVIYTHDCEKKRAIAQGKIVENFLIGTFIPECEDNGDWSSLQCDRSTGDCWCVQPDGVEVAESRIAFQQPTCITYYPISPPLIGSIALPPASMALTDGSRTESDSTMSVKCPANMTHDNCGSPCQPICGEKLVETCADTCISNCFCDYGYIWHGGECVTMVECAAFEIQASFSDCENQRYIAQSKAEENTAIFLPSCDANGDWAAVQCQEAPSDDLKKSSGTDRAIECWCVQTDGTEIINTRKGEHAKTRSERECDVFPELRDFKLEVTVASGFPWNGDLADSSSDSFKAAKTIVEFGLNGSPSLSEQALGYTIKANVIGFTPPNTVVKRRRRRATKSDDAGAIVEYTGMVPKEIIAIPAKIQAELVVATAEARSVDVAEVAIETEIIVRQLVREPITNAYDRGCPTGCWKFSEELQNCVLREDTDCYSLKCHYDAMEIQFASKLFLLRDNEQPNPFDFGDGGDDPMPSWDNDLSCENVYCFISL